MEKQNRLIQSFFNQADVFMVAVGTDELVVDINRKASEILGYSKSNARGKNWFDNFVAEEEREGARRLFCNMLSGSLRHVHSEYTLVTRKGQEKRFNFHNILVSDDNGHTIGALSSGDEVTGWKKHEEISKQIENRLQASLDFMVEGCQIIDRDWRYIYVNEAVAKQGRKKKEELLGYTMMQAYPGIDQTEMFRHLRNSMIKRVPHKMENEFVFPDGSKGWFELYMEPVPEGVLILSMDITEKKEIEAELGAYRTRLEQVVAQRTAECAEANEELTRRIEEAQKTEEGLKLRATILDNAKEAIFLVNAKGDFVYVNSAAIETYEYTLDEFLNMNIRTLFPVKDASSLNDLLRHIVEKNGTNLEMVHVRKGGAEMPVKVYANQIKTLHGQFIVFVVRRLFHR